jgi:hypothetical protein
VDVEDALGFIEVEGLAYSNRLAMDERDEPDLPSMVV